MAIKSNQKSVLISETISKQRPFKKFKVFSKFELVTSLARKENFELHTQGSMENIKQKLFQIPNNYPIRTLSLFFW
jgi:hypothetical protein